MSKDKGGKNVKKLAGDKSATKKVSDYKSESKSKYAASAIDPKSLNPAAKKK